MNAVELQNILIEFAYRIVPLFYSLPPKKISKVFEDPLTRSAFSAAANYRAACNGQSKRAFSAKLSISLEEMDESSFWLEIIEELKLHKKEKLSSIMAEATELTKILGASRRTSSQKLKIKN